MSLLALRIMRNFEATHGFPPGTNELVLAGEGSGRHGVEALLAVGLRGELLDFYGHVESASFPDAGNGLFIHSAEDVADGIRGVQPTKVTGHLEGDLTIFGSDGGGSLFAVFHNGKVYRLSGGSLIGAVYDVEPSGVDELAQDLSGFLKYFQVEVQRLIPSQWV